MNKCRLRTLLGQMPGLKRLYRWVYEDRTLRPRKTPYGFLLSATNHPAHRAMLKASFEAEETSLFVSLLPDCDCFIDIGANIGYYTCLARSLGKKVIAFEPQWRNLKLLYRNLRENGWDDVEVYPLALGDRNGIIPLYGQTSVSASIIQNWGRHSPRFEQLVSIARLDDILGARLANKKLLIKIDVEGFEYPVLQGALGLMAMSPKPVWIVEICLTEFHPGGMNRDFLATFDLFLQNGYQVRTADRHLRRLSRADLLNWINNSRCDSATNNYLFTHSSE